MQHTFKTEKGEFLVVAMPINSIGFNVYSISQFEPKQLSAYDLPDGNAILTTTLPPGNYEIICQWPNCTEEQAAMVVDPKRGIFYQQYLDYISDSYCIDIATESLASLMEREKIYTANPYGESKPQRKFHTQEYNPNRLTFSNELDRWQQAQERTSENWVILKIK